MGEITGLFDNNTLGLDERSLTANGRLPVDLTVKAKFDSFDGLDKLKASVYLRGKIQIEDDFNSWPPIILNKLLKCFDVDSLLNKVTIHQLNFIQAFILSDVEKIMFVLMDKLINYVDGVSYTSNN